MAIKVMLIDDEPHIRMILRKVIERNPGYLVAAEGASAEEALLAFQEVHPDVVFLDVDLQGANGIGVAREILKEAPDTILIFATAYAEYMPSAFELYAFDYLVKPFDIARIEHTLDRITRMVESGKGKKSGEEAGEPVPGKDQEAPGGGEGQPIKDAEEEEAGGLAEAEDPEREAAGDGGENTFRESASRSDKLMLRGKESIRFLDLEDIVMAVREGTVTVVYTDRERVETSLNLSELEKKLKEPDFLRCHRSNIIRVSRISQIEPYGRWTYLVHLDGIRETALMTKENFDRVREWYG